MSTTAIAWLYIYSTPTLVVIWGAVRRYCVRD